MTWVEKEIAVSGESVKSSIKVASDGIRVEIPFLVGVETGQTIKTDDSEYKIIKITNIGDRDETLLLEVEDGKSVSRRASSKARK